MKLRVKKLALAISLLGCAAPWAGGSLAAARAEAAGTPADHEAWAQAAIMALGLTAPSPPVANMDAARLQDGPRTEARTSAAGLAAARRALGFDGIPLSSTAASDWPASRPETLDTEVQAAAGTAAQVRQALGLDRTDSLSAQTGADEENSYLAEQDTSATPDAQQVAEAGDEQQRPEGDVSEDSHDRPPIYVERVNPIYRDEEPVEPGLRRVELTLDKDAPDPLSLASQEADEAHVLAPDSGEGQNAATVDVAAAPAAQDGSDPAPGFTTKEDESTERVAASLGIRSWALSYAAEPAGLLVGAPESQGEKTVTVARAPVETEPLIVRATDKFNSETIDVTPLSAERLASAVSRQSIGNESAATPLPSVPAQDLANAPASEASALGIGRVALGGDLPKALRVIELDPANIALASSPDPGDLDQGTSRDGANPFAGDALAMSTAQLDEMRGGFETNSGLMVSFGIERAVYINGQLATTTSFNVADVTRLSAEQARTLGSIGGTLAVVQNGPGNSFQTGTIAPGAIGTVIQNTLNNQRIQGVTVINATVNSLQVLRALNLQSALTSAVGASARH